MSTTTTGCQRTWNNASCRWNKSPSWNKVKQIKAICKACQQCQAAKVRRQQLSAAFEQADKEDLPLPRQAYGIDFYGHTHGYILVAIDLCTREVSLWLLPDGKMEGVAKALLSGIIFQRGVPLTFVNDEAQEFVGGVDTLVSSKLQRPIKCKRWTFHAASYKLPHKMWRYAVSKCEGLPSSNSICSQYCI